MFIFTTPFITARAISSSVEPDPPWKTRSRGVAPVPYRAWIPAWIAEQLGAQLHIARLVDAVNVAEGEGGNVAAVLAEAESLDCRDRVIQGRVQVLVDVMADAVFLAADDADLHFEDRGDRLHAGQDLRGYPQVLVKRHCRTVPHVRLEDRPATGGDLGLGGGDKRQEEVVERIRWTVIGVESNRDGVILRHLGDERGEGESSGCAGLDALTGEEVRAAGRHLDDAIRAGLREPLEDAVDRRRRRRVDGRVGEAVGFRPVEHVCILLGGRNGHGVSFVRAVRVGPPSPRVY
jgi:hypothetical protein